MVDKVGVEIGGDAREANAAVEDFAENFTKIFEALTSGSIKQFATAIGDLPAGMTAVLVGVGAIADKAVEAASSIKDLADKAEQIHFLSVETGIAADEISRLEGAANLTGVSTDRFGFALAHLATAMQAAISNAGKQRDAFAAVGLQVEDLQRMSAEDVIRRIADRYAQTADSAQKLAINNEFFGGRMRELLVLLDQGSARLDKLGASAKSALTPQQMETLAAFNLHWRQIGDEIGGATNAIKVWFASLLALPGANANLQKTEDHLKAIQNIKLPDGLPKVRLAPGTIGPLGNIGDAAQQRDIDKINAKESEELATEVQRFKKTMLDLEFADHQITLEQKYAGEVKSANDTYALVQANYQKQFDAAKNEPVKQAEIHAQMEVARRKHLDTLTEMQRKHLNDIDAMNKKLAEETISAEEKQALDDARAQNEIAATQQRSNTQKLADEQKYLDEVYDIRRAALVKQLILMEQDPAMDPVAHQKLLDQIAALDHKYTNDSSVVQAKAAQTVAAVWKSAADNIKGSFESAFSNMVQGTESFASAAKNAFTSLASWAVSQLLTVAEQAILGDETTRASKAAANAAIVQSNAAAAGAGATAGVAESQPYTAVAFGVGVMGATTGAFMPEAFAEEGFDVPALSSPVTQLHPREMVLPEEQADVIRGLAGRSGGGVTIHLHAMDAQDVQRALEKGGVLRQTLKKMQRDMQGI